MADRSVSLDILFGGRDVGLGSAAGGAQAKMQKLGMTLTKVGATATAVGGAITAMAYKSVQAASNLSEAMNKSEVVFGDNADAIEEWANTAADSMGMSKRAALDAGASLGNFFMNMDVGADKATDMSKEMVQLGADLASFHNLAGGAEEGLQKLQSGLAGEIEPMRRLGIVINASAVEAKALEMGLADASGEISESAKVQARYAMIMEQTSREQGDFERTSDQLANSQRRMKAKIEDATASIGQSLQPALLAVLDVAEPLIDKLEAFAKTPVGKIAIQVAAGFGALALALGPPLMLLGQLLPIITALQGAGGLAGLATAASGFAATITGTVVPAIIAMLGPLAAAIALTYAAIRAYQEYQAQAKAGKSEAKQADVWSQYAEEVGEEPEITASDRMYGAIRPNATAKDIAAIRWANERREELKRTGTDEEKALYNKYAQQVRGVQAESGYGKTAEEKAAETQEEAMQRAQQMQRETMKQTRQQYPQAAATQAAGARPPAGKPEKMDVNVNFSGDDAISEAIAANARVRAEIDRRSNRNIENATRR